VNEVSDSAERHAEKEVRDALKGLLRNLKDVKEQRMAAGRGILPSASHRARIEGELWGLDTAIKAIERRLR
jgi:hypothetical protein